MCPTSRSRTSKRSTSSAARTFNHYPWGWTYAGNTPFRRWKRETYRGGICDPFIVHWPKGIEAQGRGALAIRTRHRHGADRARSAGIEAPASISGVTQSPIEGLSFAHALNDAAAPSKHMTQYFEMLGHRSIYHDGWRAVCPWPGPSFTEQAKGFGDADDGGKLTRNRRDPLGALRSRGGPRRDQQCRR